MRFWFSKAAAADKGHPHTISLKLRDTSQPSIRWTLLRSLKRTSTTTRKNLSSVGHRVLSNAPIKLRIHLDQWPAEDPQAMIKTAVHNYFAHRAKITGLEFKRLLRRGRTSLFIGMLFLSVCLFLSKMLLGHEEGTWAAVVREGLTIAGWVAMWRPMQIYLYDWWPLLQLRRVFTKLSHMPVEVVQKGKS